MSVQSNEEFRDPALKDAVRRCWACDCASEHLRKRVAAMLVEEKSAGSSRGPMRIDRFRSWVLWPLAAAALLVISVGVLNHYGALPGHPLLASSLPASLETDLIRTHDHCCKMENHEGLPVPKTDDVAIANLMREKLNQPVLMFRPTDADWKFKGASICRVGKVESGHLVFAKTDSALSIFSLPKTLIPEAKEGSQFAATVDGHSIVGFVKNGALFFAVGSGSADVVGVDELEKMAQQMKPAVAFAPSNPPESGVVLTELLQPIR
jgi:hypothetical protein